MGAQSIAKPISKGQCAFCQAELAKNKMTQHLKTCKQRQAIIEAQEKASQQPKTCLFHILAEGRYDPQYWLHFEMPDNASLGDIDTFLQSMWIDDNDHLSSFTINGTNYDSDEPFYFGELIEEKGEATVDAEEMTEEEEAQALSEDIEKFLSEYIEGMDELMSAYPGSVNPFSPEWIAEIKKPRSVDELIPFLKDEIARVSATTKAAWALKGDQAHVTTTRINAMALSTQETFLKGLLLDIEDDSMNALLKSVLKVGQKFSYIYDFGSSTYINLRVIAEREGISPSKEDADLLLAQNTAPEFKCIVCGKPATQVKMEDTIDSLADATYCDACTEKKEYYEEEMMPLINSPRVGVL